MEEGNEPNAQDRPGRTHRVEDAMMDTCVNNSGQYRCAVDGNSLFPLQLVCLHKGCMILVVIVKSCH